MGSGRVVVLVYIVVVVYSTMEYGTMTYGVMAAGEYEEITHKIIYNHHDEIDWYKNSIVLVFLKIMMIK